MIFFKILTIAILCYTKLGGCQAAKPKSVWFKDFFNYNIKVDYTSCDQSSYSNHEDDGWMEDDEDYQSGSGYGEDVNDDENDVEKCLRYCFN